MRAVRRKNNFPGTAAGVCLAILLLACTDGAGAVTNIVLRLSNGDRITGTLVSTNSNQVIVTTSWAGNMSVPAGIITNRELIVVQSAAVSDLIAVKPPSPPAAPTASIPARKAWKTDVKFGADFQSGAKDRSIYFGTFRLTYEKPIKSEQKRYFRNVLDSRADYGDTEGEKSVNRMSGSMKTDYDVSTRWYLYNLGIAGYDEFRKIEFGYEIGPGMGYRVFMRPAFTFDVESGLNYQFQDRTDGEDVEALFLRFAENITWKIAPRVTFSEKFEFYPSLERMDDFRLRFESTLSFGIVQNVSVNFSVLDVFDTRPARNVDRNEFLFRSSLGLTF